MNSATGVLLVFVCLCDLIRFDSRAWSFVFLFLFRVMDKVDTPGNSACMHFILDGGVGKSKIR